MEKTIKTFEDLLVWQKGIELVKEIYLLTKRPEFSKDFAFRDQLRRAAISISTNIEEGYERASRKEYLQVLNIAKGSAGEVRSLLRLAIEIGYIDSPRYENLRNFILEISRYLSNLMRSLRG